MDLQLKGSKFAVGGASGGLGQAITERLIQEGATVIGIARSQDKLQQLADTYGSQFIPFTGSLSDSTTIRILGERLVQEKITGCVFNTGGPPTGQIDELEMKLWDEAYSSTLRWKVQLTKAILPAMRKRRAGKLLYLESLSIKQPIDNLVLSNTFRAAVAGFVKTLSREEGPYGITANILAPGYHATDRITTVLNEAAKLRKTSRREIEREFLAEVHLGELGNPQDLAKMAVFLLSPAAPYITGQTVTLDGGVVRYTTG